MRRRLASSQHVMLRSVGGWPVIRVMVAFVWFFRERGKGKGIARVYRKLGADSGKIYTGIAEIMGARKTPDARAQSQTDFMDSFG
jgi:hypothetical protein